MWRVIGTRSEEFSGAGGGGGNEKFAITNSFNASRETGFAAWNRARISAGFDLGVASAKVLLSANTRALCTATNRSLNKACGGLGYAAALDGSGCEENAGSANRLKTTPNSPPPIPAR